MATRKRTRSSPKKGKSGPSLGQFLRGEIAGSIRRQKREIGDLELVVQPMIELALGLYFTATVFYALANGIYGTLPFLILFQLGFLYTALLSIMQQFAGTDAVLKPVEE